MKKEYASLGIDKAVKDYINESIRSMPISVTVSDFLLSATKRFMRDYQVEGLTVFEDQEEVNEQPARVA